MVAVLGRRSPRGTVSANQGVGLAGLGKKLPFHGFAKICSKAEGHTERRVI